MQAKDLMRKQVLTVTEEDRVSEVLDMMVREHIHGAPVVSQDGELI